jgi:rhodanese-related sulfurtransferase
MKRGLILQVVIILALVSTSLCNAGMMKYEGKDVPTVSAKVAYKDFKSGKAVFVDCMPPEDFAVQHVVGAVNLPNNGPEDKAALQEASLPWSLDQVIYVYCG